MLVPQDYENHLLPAAMMGEPLPRALIISGDHLSSLDCKGLMGKSSGYDGDPGFPKRLLWSWSKPAPF